MKFFLLSFIITLINVGLKIAPILFISKEIDKMISIRSLVVESIVINITLFGFLWLSDLIIIWSNSELVLIVICVLGATFFTTFEYIIKPILMVTTSKDLESNKEIDKILQKYFPKNDFKLRIINKNIKNAYATGIIGFSKCILVGKSLTDILSKDSLTCVLLHEMGHIRKHHMLKLFIYAFLISSIYGFSVLKLYPLYTDISYKYILVFIHGGIFGLLLLLIPGLIQKEFEYEADLFAVDIFGKEKYINALKDLDELSNGMVSRGGITHPSLKKRIFKIEKAND